MRACSIAIPSARSLSYTVRNASELILPPRRLVASSSVKGAEVSSTLLVIGLYQCMNTSPFPFLEVHLKVYLREDFYHRGAAKYGAQGHIVLKNTERPPEEVACHTKPVAP